MAPKTMHYVFQSEIAFKYIPCRGQEVVGDCVVPKSLEDNLEEDLTEFADTVCQMFYELEYAGPLRNKIPPRKLVPYLSGKRGLRPLDPNQMEILEAKIAENQNKT